MGGKIKKFFKIIISNKKLLFFSLGLILFLSLVPFHFAQANIFADIYQWIATLPLKIAGLVAALFLFVIALEAAFLFFIVTNILSWIVKIVITIPIIPTGTGSVVDVGWGFTRDFANMFFILILVFIGLATILKIKEYEAKKTLPLLILVAILINFSPVIVGFVVDISNLFTNFFLSKTGADFETLGNVFDQGKKTIWDALTAFGKFQDFPVVIGNLIAIILFGFALSIFYGFATAVYCFVIFLLWLRIAYLWILMILAPIAFLFYIFPATRKLPMVGWDDWWQNLVKWSIIGIPLGFFLYLSTYIMQNQGVVSDFFGSPTITDPVNWTTENLLAGIDFTTPFANLLGSMIAPFTALLLLYLGTQMAKKLAPEAAIQAIEGIKKGFKMTASVALVAATGGAAAGLAAKGLGGIAKGAQVAEKAMGRVPVVGKALKYGVGKPISYMTRGAEIAGKPWLLEREAMGEKVPAEDLKKFKELAPADKPAWLESKLSQLILPGLKAKHGLQYGAAMETADFENAPEDFQDEIMGYADQLKKDPRYKKMANNIMNKQPDKISKKMKIDFELEDDRPEMEQRIEEMEGRIKDRFSEEQIESFVRVKLKLKPEEIVTSEMKKKFIESQAAGAVHVVDMKTKDMDEITRESVDSVAMRLGMTYGGTSGKMEKIQDIHKKARAEKVLDGPGGLNYMVKGIQERPDLTDEEKDKRMMEMLKDVQKENETYLRWFFTNPAGRKYKLAIRNVLKEKYHTQKEKKKPNFDIEGRIAYEKFATEAKREEKVPAVSPVAEVSKEDLKSQEKIDEIHKKLKEVGRKKEDTEREAGNLREQIEEFDIRTAVTSLEEFKRALDEKEAALTQLGEEEKRLGEELARKEKPLPKEWIKPEFSRKIGEEIERLKKKPKDEKIRERTYQIYEKRGRTDRPDMSRGESEKADWLEAEKEIMENRNPIIRTLTSRKERIDRELEAAGREAELVKAPPSLPKVERGMPTEMKGLIRSGNKYISEINTQTNRYKTLKESERDLETRLGSLKSEIEKLTIRVNELNEKERTVGLTTAEISLRGTLQDEITDRSEQITKTQEFVESVKTQVGSVKEAVTNLKTKLETEIREPLKPHQEEWEAKKKGETEEKEIKRTYKKLKKELK